MISYQLLFGKWNLLTHICRNSIAPSLVWHVRVHEETAVVLLPHYSLTGLVCITIVITRDNGSRMHYSFYSFNSVLWQLSCDIIASDDGMEQ